MHIGYARVSTQDQNLDLQQDALKKAGCQKIIVDRVGGTVAERPGLAQVKELLREGDTLVVWRFDRLGRSVKDLIAWVNWLEQEGIGLQSLQEAIDTTSTGGRLTFHLFAAGDRDVGIRPGCERVFTDVTASVQVTRRPGLNSALEYLRQDDTFVTLKLMRLNLPIKQLLNFFVMLEARGVSFQSLYDPIDPVTSEGQMR